VTVRELLLVGGAAGVGKTSVGWEVSVLRRAMGAGPPVRVTSVLLTAAADVVRERLAGREIGSELAAHVRRSLAAADRLAREAPAHTVRIATDGRSVARVAQEVVRAAAW
jgi:hypothetical protein